MPNNALQPTPVESPGLDIGYLVTLGAVERGRSALLLIQ